MSWKLAVTAPRLAIEAALARQEADPDWDPALVVTGFEVDPDEPEVWQLDAYCQGKPSQANRNAIKALFDDPVPRIRPVELPDADWVSESQKGMDPIRAGRFHVRTPDHPRTNELGVRDFCIPAAQAFGTGLLAFAAMHLWPRARATASDIDPVCLPAVEENAELNGVALGTGPGQLEMIIAEGMDDDDLVERAPYDVLIANILAAPLIELAPAFAASMAPRGHIVLSGLLVTQEAHVRAAYRLAGYRLQARITSATWSVFPGVTTARGCSR